jgi:hypothetical protein
MKPMASSRERRHPCRTLHFPWPARVPALPGLAAGVAMLLAACGNEPTGPTGPTSAPFTVTDVTAERSGAHLHLTVNVRVKNSGPAPLTLGPPAAQLWIAGARTAPPFIAPGLEPGVISPGAENDAATHWWLAANDLSGSLELEISGARQLVKSPGVFPADALDERKPAPLSWPDWKPARRSREP